MRKKRQRQTTAKLTIIYSRSDRLTHQFEIEAETDREIADLQRVVDALDNLSLECLGDSLSLSKTGDEPDGKKNKRTVRA